jgi:hypothetical protein
VNVFRVFLLLMHSQDTQKTRHRLTGLCAECFPSSGCLYFLYILKTPKRRAPSSGCLYFLCIVKTPKRRALNVPRLPGVFTSYA